MSSNGNKTFNLAPVVAVLLGLIVAFHLGNAFVGKSLIRASHLGTALAYAHDGIDLLKPVIPGFNAAETPTAQELPLWQASVALAFQATHSTWYGWANLVSLILFATGLWPLFQLARPYVGERAAWWSLVFFLAQPLIVVQAGKASTDGFCLAVSFWFLYFADRMIRSGQWRWWFPTALFACLAAITKLPFFMVAGWCSVAMLFVNRVRTWQPWALLISAGLVATGVFAAWAHYCDSLSGLAEYPYMELRLAKSPYAFHFFFGDLHTRLSPGGWLKGGWRFLHATVGSLPFVALLLAALLRPGYRLPKLWLLATLLTTLVFTNLVLIHWHYYLMCCAPVALLCGATLARWENFWAKEIASRWFRFSLVVVALAGSALDGVIAMKIAIDYDYFPKAMSALVRQHTRPEDRLLVFKCDTEWPGEVLFRAERKGLYVPSLESSPTGQTPKGLLELLANETDLQRLRALGYTKLVLLSESTARVAVEAVNPGSQRQRVMYPASLSPKVDAWPTVYRSEDLLIKEIPAAP